MVSCAKEATAPYVGFGSSTYSVAETASESSVPLRLYNSPYKFPVKVNVSVETACDYPLDQMITYDQTEGFEIEYDNSTRFYFTPIDNDFLNADRFEFTVTITSVDGADIGTTSKTTITIVDDELAPRLTSGTYTVTNPESGSFSLKLVKVGKYKYVAYNWFGLDRPRLLGTFDPEASTLTFDGTDYTDYVASNDDVMAFGRAYYFDSVDRSSVLVFRGSGVDGKQPIVIATEKVAQDASGSPVSALSSCAFDVYGYDVEQSAVLSFKSTSAAMETGAKFAFEYPADDEPSDDDEQTRSMVGPVLLDRPVRVY